ncbi:hypothetical protein ASG90_17150 [Nocardioides sp. Soil797]|nr:hypothetical protein ASG90_17150 [Nocardioides sp. Soil797]
MIPASAEAAVGEQRSTMSDFARPRFNLLRPEEATSALPTLRPHIATASFEAIGLLLHDWCRPVRPWTLLVGLAEEVPHFVVH